MLSCQVVAEVWTLVCARCEARLEEVFTGPPLVPPSMRGVRLDLTTVWRSSLSLLVLEVRLPAEILR